MIKKAIPILKKEILSEIRTRYALSTTLLFVLVAISIILFAFKDTVVESELVSGIYWIIMFFSANVGLSKSYISEEERGTGIFLKLISYRHDVFWGKLLFNIIYCAAINFISAFLLFLLLEVRVESIFSFILVIFFSSLCIGSIFSSTSAIISKANTKNALLPIISFPLIIPILIIGIEAINQSILGVQFNDSIRYIVSLFSFFGIYTIIFYIVFDQIWID